MSKPISDLREDVRRNFFAQKRAEGMTEEEEIRESLNRVARFWGMMGFDLAAWVADDAADARSGKPE